MKLAPFAAASLALTLVAGAGWQALAAVFPSIPAYIAAAVADPNRPQTDTDRDALRKPAEVVTFAKIKPGQAILELIPARGYFTRILSKVIGPTGHDYTALPQITGVDVSRLSSGLAADPHYGNISEVPLTPDGIKGVGPVDVIWIT